MSARPLVGIGVIVVYPSRYPSHVLVSERLSGHGKGTTQLPGGHLEFGESFEECAQRELEEETNLRSTSFRFIHLVNTISEEKDEQAKHYVTIFMKTIIDDDSTLKCLEPQNNSDWSWVKWNDLKTRKLFAPLKQALEDEHFDPFKD